MCVPYGPVPVLAVGDGLTWSSSLSPSPAIPPLAGPLSWTAAWEPPLGVYMGTWPPVGGPAWRIVPWPQATAGAKNRAQSAHMTRINIGEPLCVGGQALVEVDEPPDTTLPAASTWVPVETVLPPGPT